jgi:hypothetical protein
MAPASMTQPAAEYAGIRITADSVCGVRGTRSEEDIDQQIGEERDSWWDR